MYQKLAIVFIFVGIFINVHGQKCNGATVVCPNRCQEPDTGIALPVATICEDQRADCGLLFNCDGEGDCEDATAPPAPTDTNDPPLDFPKIRPQACDEPTTQDLAMQCAKTCMICCETPEYNCDDDDTGIVDCAANIAKCQDANWTDIMAQYCPASCGLCLAGTCADINNGCNTMASLCRDIEFYDYMGANCARTCDRCPDSGTNTTTAPGNNNTCSDIANNCAQNSNLCTNTLYRELMSQQCCATCSGSSGGGSTCTDSNANCATWVRNGFCTSTFYNNDQKRQYCGRSCGLC